MAKTRQKTKEIQDFILENVEENPQDIASLAAGEFNISRQAIFRYTQKLESRKMLISEGNTRNKKYGLALLKDLSWEFPLEGLEEDKVWRKNIRPHIADLPKNILDIFDYGVTEMINNAIDHSEGDTLTLSLQRTAIWATVRIEDNGIGIFNKIQRDLDLDDPRHAVLELSKGKLTTDPTRHTGEGIFFTSRMFDLYSIRSGMLHLAHIGKKDSAEGRDWLLEEENLHHGTAIRLKIHLNSSRILKDVFDHYATPDEYGFDKTKVPVFLATYGDENLISRSQAKRLLARFEKFKEIILDFKNVDMIGQAFADEIFRVFQSAHPTIKFHPVNTNEQVQRMIQRAIKANIE